MGLWFWKEGNLNYLLEHPLNENSVVFEVGGYTGVFTQNLFDKYGCSVYVFEPVDIYFNELVQKFGNNPKIRLFNFGLGSSSGKVTFGISDDKSSLYSKSAQSEQIELVDVAEFFNDHPEITSVDLVNMNIEGGEFNLIPRFVQSGEIKKVKRLQVQFHNVLPNAENLREKIISDLSNTHNLIFSFPFVWDGFELK